MTSPPFLFVDSDAFIALARVDDSSHDKALKILDMLKQDQYTFITSNYVFSEVVTVLSLRLGRETAVTFIEHMKSTTSGYSMQWINEQIEQKAIEIFIKQASKNVSFVDCTNMAIMKMNDITTIFSFDTVYHRNGFTLVGDILEV